MASGSEGEFESWLGEYLDSAGVDGEVFSGYISGTLATLEGAAVSEIQESLLEVLQSCIEDESMCLSVCKDILTQWKKETDRRQTAKALPVEEFLPPTVREQDTPAVSARGKEEGSGVGPQGIMSSEEKRKLLDQYDCESDGEEDLASHSAPVKKSGGSRVPEDVFVNSNTSVVGDTQKLHRELLKAEHEAKMERDRKEREAQKQRTQDRKEKEKKRTQKQERRR